MVQWLCLFILLLAPVYGKSASLLKDKGECTSRELKAQDCRLKVGSVKVRLSATTVARDNGTSRSVDDMPLKGEGVVWQKANLKMFGDWPVLQIWLWDSGQGTPKVQSLHWYVADAHEIPLKILAEGVVRKKRDNIFDREEPHSLKALKGHDQLEWSLSKQKKILKRIKHGV